MRIWILTCELAHEVAGGIARYVDNFSRLLGSAGHEVTVIGRAAKDCDLRPSPGVRVLRTACDATQPVELHRLSPSARLSIERFSRWRWAFGRLHEPDAVAREVALESNPAAELRVVVAERVFDYDSKTVDRVESIYVYPGSCPGDGGPS